MAVECGGYVAQNERAAALGYRPSKAPVCPRVVVGKRCVLYWGRSKSCSCQDRFGRRALFDHGRMWLDEEGQHVLTAEPYGASGVEVAALVTDLVELGLDLRISADSPWYPGSTILLTITRKAATA